MKNLGCKGLLLLGGMLVWGGTLQAQYLRSSYFLWKGQVHVYS